MFTQCPECQTLHSLTLAQLRANRGILRCSRCSATFDALEHSRETREAEKTQSPPAQSLPWDKKITPNTAYWGAGLAAGVLLLMAQIVYFEGHALGQNPAVRPALEKLCGMVNCHPPVYRNLDEFTLLHGSFTPLPDQNYILRVVITNQAAFAQTYPGIKLNLFDYNGEAFASRIFQPRDYLAEKTDAALMPPNETTEIKLTIAAPKNKIGGTTFELVY
jgi:predicted Zn finger-like uncharacterized protein